MTVVLIAVLASIGAGGVPGTGLIMLTLVLTQLGLPLEVVGFVAGVDPILDRLRTMTNVTGDLAVTTVVATGTTRSTSRRARGPIRRGASRSAATPQRGTTDPAAYLASSSRSNASGFSILLMSPGSSPV